MICDCEKCQRELKAMRALESLTPSGSEFVNDVERCVSFVREHDTVQHRMIIQLTKQRNALHTALQRINHLATVELNGTSVGYYITNRADIATESSKALEAK